MFATHNQNNDPAGSEVNERLTAQMKKLRQLYPELTEQELMRAKEKLDRYLELAFRIFKRTQLERTEESHSPTEPL